MADGRRRRPWPATSGLLPGAAVADRGAVPGHDRATRSRSTTGRTCRPASSPRRWRAVSSRSAPASCRSCCCARWCGTRSPRTWPRTWPRSRASSGSRRGWSGWPASSPHGSLGLAAVDFTRNGYEGTWNEEASAAVVHSTPRPARRLGVLGRRPRAGGAVGGARAPATRTRSGARCGRCTRPAGSPSRARRARHHRSWPSTTGCTCWRDYGTMVESEVEVFGLIARANDDMHAFSLLAMVISLFETGYLARGAGLFESSPGHFSSEPGHGGAAVRRHGAGRPLPRRRDRVRQHRLPRRWTGSRWRTSRARTCGSASIWSPSRPRHVAAGSVGPVGAAAASARSR